MNNATMVVTYFQSLLSGLSPITVVLFLIVITVTSIFTVNKVFGDSFRGPGPWGIPVLGYYPFLKDDYHVYLGKLTKKYGDAYLINICGKRFLHIGTKKAAKETFVRKSDCFPGRCEDFSLINFVFANGLTFMVGEEWQTSRKFLIKSMRTLGLGARDQLKDPIFNSVQTAVNFLTENEGKAVNIASLLSSECSKVISHMIMGDDVPKETLKRINDAFLITLLPIGGTGILIFGNIGRYLVAPRIKGFNQIFSAKREMDALFYEIINNHRKAFNPDYPRDFIDLCLREKQTREAKGDFLAKCFSDEAIMPTIFQVYGDGGMTVGVILASFVHSLSQKIDIQNAMYEEINREIGTERFPSYEDRNQLPFVLAVIKELQRTSSLVPVAPSVECSYETTICGTRVPKGTIALVNFHAIHNDSDVYKNPERFDPTRFLTDDVTKRSAEDLPMFFNIGKRSCPGEELVMTEIFLFLTALMQRFTLRLVEESEPKKQGNTEMHDTMEFKVIPISRMSKN